MTTETYHRIRRMQRAEQPIESGRSTIAHAAALHAWERDEPALLMFVDRPERHKLQ